MKPRELIKHIHGMQSQEELEFLVSILEEVKPKRILEIGTGSGSTTTLFAYMSDKVITVDKRNCLDTNTRELHYWGILKQRGILDKELNITYIEADSNKKETFDKVNGKYDLVIIDAGHLEIEGWLDWKFYASLAPVVGIHDTADYKNKDRDKIDWFPSTFWSLVKKISNNKTKEINPKNGGWGFIWMEEKNV